MVHPQSHGGEAKIVLILLGSAPLEAYDDPSHDDCKPCSDAKELSFKDTSVAFGLEHVEEPLLVVLSWHKGA